MERQPAYEFAAPAVGVEPGTEVWLWESVLMRDGEPVAHLQENISAQPVSFGGRAAAPLETNDDGGSTLLATLNKAGGRVFWARRVPDQPQPGRAEPREAAGPARLGPVLVLTQYVRHANRPFYLAKCLIADRAGQLSVMQSLQS